jgi:hypothetical protein
MYIIAAREKEDHVASLYILLIGRFKRERSGTGQSPLILTRLIRLL